MNTVERDNHLTALRVGFVLWGSIVGVYLLWPVFGPEGAIVGSIAGAVAADEFWRHGGDQ